MVAKTEKTIPPLSDLQLVRGHLSRSLVGDEFVGELLAFLEIPQSGTFDGGNMDEDVLPTIVGLNEAEAFGGVEPLHCTICHDELLFPCVEDRSIANASSGLISTMLGRSHQHAHDTTVFVRVGLNVQPKIDGLKLGPGAQDVKAVSGPAAVGCIDGHSSGSLRDKDASMTALHKACPVVIRDKNGRTEILAFRHPMAGVQIVKGSIEPSEAPATAAARELVEESGIVGRATTDLGSALIGDPPARWHFFGMEAQDLPDGWCHRTSDDHGHVFAFFWHPLDVLPDTEWHASFREALAYIVLARTRIDHGAAAAPPLDLAAARSGPQRGPP